MSDDITIHVNGIELKAKRGQMLIEVTDAAGIYIPRFCYHQKLSIAANCRMCLVEMENGRKPMPACATPVADGNVFFTKSEAAIDAQRATMEFLLINHPLDCPICDQGGECELQDLAMGYGRGVSRYVEKKRVVADKNLGPLVSTDMTRCIHCTRCVRFGTEVAGMQELGTMGRGENMEISTFVEQSVDHEMSGNIIDLCPVGALNSKPARYTGRSWEMMQHESIAPHDSVGSNIYVHVKNGKVMRVVPKDAEEINETWICDRDRFSYTGIYSEDRLTAPRVKGSEGWREVDWATALEAATSKLGALSDGSKLGALVSPHATLEEQHLATQLARGLGSANIDHRLRQQDISHQQADPVYPWLGCTIADLEAQKATLVIGSNVRAEAPIIAHRLRKSTLNGGRVMFVNPPGYEYLFDVAHYIDAEANTLVAELRALVMVAEGQVTASLSGMAADVTEAHRQTVSALREQDDALVLLGHLGQRHAQAAAVRALSAQLATLTGAKFGVIPEAVNSVGASLVGALPHRGLGGAPVETAGLAANDMWSADLASFLLVGVEPERDSADGAAALAALKKAQFVVCLTSFVSDDMLEYADVLLPIGTFAETAGTFVNLEGRWQSFSGVATPVGSSRPGWKVLRVLAENLQLEGFAFNSAADIAAHVKATLGDVQPSNALDIDSATVNDTVSAATIDVPIYDTDPLVRRAQPLQKTRAAQASAGIA
ncbi:MAG: NADH-quinone oxidoreductase subunit NuoG [Gammaproteobacteria bacterium]